MALDRSPRAGFADSEEDHGCGDLPDTACRDVPGNAARIIVSLTLQKAGDAVVDAKAVLPWLLGVLGAPPFLAGLLVPIRESGSMLPQAALVPWVRRRPVRSRVWVAGAIGQAAAVAALALVALRLRGAAAGWAVLGALAAFALARSLSSIATKDVLGRTVPKGRRGAVNGWATVGAGLVAITVGVGIRLLGGEDVAPSVLALLLAGGCLAWLVAAAVFSTVQEHAERSDGTLQRSWVSHAAGLLRTDRAFRRFVVTRTLLLVSALSPPFVVTLATEQVGTGVGDLGPFVVATGLAALLAGRGWGGLADRSSRGVMMLAAAISSAVVLALLAALAVPGVAEVTLLYPATYLLLALAHTGTRIGRKTYVVDLAEGDRRTDYVAVSNTAMGFLLLVAGGISSALAALGVEVALAFLALLGLLGVAAARTLPEVSASRARQ